MVSKKYKNLKKGANNRCPNLFQQIYFYFQNFTAEIEKIVDSMINADESDPEEKINLIQFAMQQLNDLKTDVQLNRDMMVLYQDLVELPKASMGLPKL